MNDEVEGIPAIAELFNATTTLLKSAFTLLLGIACLTPCFVTGAEPAIASESATPDNAPCAIIEKAPPRFPSRMLKDGVAHGAVKMLLHVSSTGDLTDTLITAFTKKPFADEALRAVKRWKFTPGRSKGEAIDTVINMTFQFEVKEVLLVEKFSPDATLLEHYEGFDYHACNVQNLDRVPTPLNIVEPTYPQEWMKQDIAGNIIVDFFIDETGKARFPTAIPGTNELLAGIAVAAVQQWRFIPPTAKGKPVLVRARQVFTFEKEDKS